MSVRTHAAAKFICRRGDWQVTNLALQKILYMAHMVHYGRTGHRLVKRPFEAWEYGPVEPKLYRHVRAFGADPIQDVFSTEPSIRGTPEADTLVEACDALLKLRPAQLVAITHRKGGAWERNYQPGVRGIEIPDADILDEYRIRKAASDNAKPA
ncbi:MAG: Panacea domain-containing protein [Reyranella sp.]